MAKLLKMLWEYMDLTVLPFFETWGAHIFGWRQRVCWCTNEASYQRITALWYELKCRIGRPHICDQWEKFDLNILLQKNYNKMVAKWSRSVFYWSPNVVINKKKNLWALSSPLEYNGDFDRTSYIWTIQHLKVWIRKDANYEPRQKGTLGSWNNNNDNNV